MMFSLRDDINKPIMSLGAMNEKEAWEKIKHIGIRNQSNIFKLVRIG